VPRRFACFSGAGTASTRPRFSVRSLLRFARKTQKIADQSIFYPANSHRTEGSRNPVIRIFALLVAQKSTSTTGCYEKRAEVHR
jgi:hypothetical protein